MLLVSSWTRSHFMLKAFISGLEAPPCLALYPIILLSGVSSGPNKSVCREPQTSLLAGTRCWITLLSCG